MSYNYGKGSGSTGKVNSDTPSGGAGHSLSSKQSSGATKHKRRNQYNKAGTGTENLSNMPNVHSGGGKGSIAGIAGKAKNAPNQQKAK